MRLARAGIAAAMIAAGLAVADQAQADGPDIEAVIKGFTVAAK
jgi:hypothetical protein